MSRQLLAFKRGPTVEMQLDNLGVLINDDRVHLEGCDGAWFSWDEWRDFAARVEKGIQWIEENTPDDAGGPSYKADDQDV